MAGVTPYTHDDWKKTNADRIRSMTDEELAKLLDNARVSCGGVMGGRNCMADCRKCWLDWLRQEVEGC